MVNGAQLNKTSSCYWKTDWVAILVYSSVVTQQIIFDKIQFVLSVPWIVISVLVSFVVKRRVSSWFCVELYLTTAALGATLQNLIVQIYSLLSFHVLMAEHVWSSGQVQFVSSIAPKQFQHKLWSDGRCKGCCISTQNVQRASWHGMHWQQRRKTSPYKAKLQLCCFSWHSVCIYWTREHSPNTIAPRLFLWPNVCLYSYSSNMNYVLTVLLRRCSHR